MNLSLKIENHNNNIHGESFTKEDVIAAIKRAGEGKYLSVTEAALGIKGKLCATKPVVADREDVEAISRILLGEWDTPLTAEEAVARDYYLSCNKEEQAILRLIFQAALRDEDFAAKMREMRNTPQHPELVTPALNKAIADVHWLLSKRVA